MVVGWGLQGYRTRDPDAWGVHGHIQHKGWGRWWMDGDFRVTAQGIRIHGEFRVTYSTSLRRWWWDGDFRVTAQGIRIHGEFRVTYSTRDGDDGGWMVTSGLPHKGSGYMGSSGSHTAQGMGTMVDGW